MQRSAPADAVHLTVVKSCKSEASLAGASNQTFEKSHAATTRWQQTLKINKVYLPIYGSKFDRFIGSTWDFHQFELVWVVGQ